MEFQLLIILVNPIAVFGGVKNMFSYKKEICFILTTHCFCNDQYLDSQMIVGIHRLGSHSILHLKYLRYEES